MSGSDSLSHSALDGYHSADTGPVPPALYLRAGLLDWAIRRAWSEARTSIHMIAGRRCRPWPSSATTVQVVASYEMPATASGVTPALCIASRTELTNACHHSSGSCSAHPGRGWVSWYGVAANASGRPSVSNTPTRQLSVP